MATSELHLQMLRKETAEIQVWLFIYQLMKKTEYISKLTKNSTIDAVKALTVKWRARQAIYK